MSLKTPAKKTYVPGRSQKIKSDKSMVGRTADWWDKEGRKMSSSQLCSRCDAVWYDGHWHTSPLLAAKLKAERKGASVGKATKDVLCNECHYAVHGPAEPTLALYEGQVTLDGLMDAAEKAEVLATVRNFGKRATKRDSEDRIISIDDRGVRVVITTTENQMAVGLGKAVHAAFKGGKLRIVWSKDDLPARVYWVRKP